MKKLSVACHVLELTGLYFALRAWLGVLHEGVHALGHTAHGLTLLGRLFDDSSPAPGLLSLCFTITVTLVVVTQTRLSRAVGVGRFLEAYPLSIALCFAAMLAITICLWHGDLRYIPHPPFGPLDPVAWALLIIPVFAFLLGACPMLLYQFTKRTAFLHVFSAGPLLAALATTFAFPAHVLEEEWHMALPAMYPRLRWVAAAIVMLAAGHLAARHLWSRVAHEEHVDGISAVSVGIWSWFVLFAVGLALLSPYHHMCFRLIDDPERDGALASVGLTFLCLWCAIGAVQWLRYRSRARLAT